MIEYFTGTRPVWREVRPRLVFNTDVFARRSLLCGLGCAWARKATDYQPDQISGIGHKIPMNQAGNIGRRSAHSIIPVLDERDLQKARDGVVEYKSAHVDYVESELIVRSPHSCLNQPATVEEVRRILHEHLKELP